MRCRTRIVHTFAFREEQEDTVVTCKCGVWFGCVHRIRGVVTGTRGWILNARLSRRLTEDMQWNARAFLHVKRRPRRPNPTSDGASMQTMTTQRPTDDDDDDDDGLDDGRDHVAAVRPHIVEPENTEANQHAEQRCARDM